MKRLSILFVALLTGQVALAQQVKSYEIIGNVKNLPAKMVYLITMKRSGPGKLDWPKIDSAVVIDGKFRLNRDTTLLDPSWATSIIYKDSLTNKGSALVFENTFNDKRKSSSFILENSKMTIDGNAKETKGLVLTGSPETELLYHYELLSPGLYTTNDKIDSLKKNGNKIKLSEALSFKNDSLISFKKKLFKLTAESPWSWMTLMNVYQNAELFTPSELAQITKLFTEEVLATGKGKLLIGYEQRSKNVVAGARFPAFDYKNLNQKNVALQAVKGSKGTIVVFWASWCGPCRAEIPELKKLYSEYKSKGINMVSISVDHDIDAWKKALKAEAMLWPNIANLPGDKDEVYRKYNLNAIPAIFLLDAQNAIVMTNDYRVDVLKENLDKLLAKK